MAPWRIKCTISICSLARNYKESIIVRILFQYSYAIGYIFVLFLESHKGNKGASSFDYSKAIFFCKIIFADHISVNSTTPIETNACSSGEEKQRYSVRYIISD